MPKEVTEQNTAASGETAPEPNGTDVVKFIKNFNPFEEIKLPGGKTFSFKGKTSAIVTDKALISNIRKVGARYMIIEDPPFDPNATKSTSN